ncbi:hypothetical protein N9R79_01960 [Vibrio sp.]|nr:hypothetical protein [Vibrio sp.]
MPDEHSCYIGTYNGWYYDIEDLKKMGLDNITMIDRDFPSSIDYSYRDLGELTLCKMPKIFST